MRELYSQVFRLASKQYPVEASTVYTGKDGLRWQSENQPSMGFKISAVYKNGTKVLLCGRDMQAGLPFGRGGTWRASFLPYTWAEKDAALDGPQVHEIAAFEIQTERAQQFGTLKPKPLLGPPAWSFQGIHIGVAERPQRSNGFTGWTTLVSDFNINRNLGMGEVVRIPVSIAKPFDIRIPIK